MFILNVVGVIAILAGGLAILVGLSAEQLIWVAMGVSSAISGVLFLALDRGLVLLAEIRDALVEKPAGKLVKATSFDKAFLDDN